MHDQRSKEYAALRATIRERGTARVALFWLGIAAWAALLLALMAVSRVPAGVLVTLLVLAATFEAGYALHVGVERIGRYLQVCHEDAWEAAAMAYGRRFPGGGPDPLFSAVFSLAALVNLLPLLLLDPVPAEWIPLGLAHAVFALRIAWARRRAGVQRDEDLRRFRALAGDGHGAAGAPTPGA